ncbi:MAG: hypothetical protein AAF527_07825, partial [Pseudomonadota bacterium]
MRTISTGAALALTLGAAVASEAAEPDPVTHCAETSADAAAEIDCLRRVIRDLLPETYAEAEAPPARVASSMDAATDEAPPPEAAPAAEPELGAEQVERRARRTEKSAEESDTAARAEETPQTIITRVVDFDRNAKGQLILVLENGQVWKQRAGDARTVRLKRHEKPQVEIRKGALSGYRIKFLEKGR